MFGKYNGFVSKARGVCMHVFSSLYIMKKEGVPEKTFEELR
jgi:hypothetical protein